MFEQELLKEFKRALELLSKELKNVGIILSGPSGVGKTTNSLMLQSYFPNLKESISGCTRSPRKGEVHGVDYYFMTPAEFKQKEKDGFFAETKNPYEDDWYGTPNSECDISKGSKIYVVDVIGARTLKQKYPHFITIFIQPPSTEILEERLRGREDNITEEVIQRRLKRYELEKEFEKEADYSIVNDDKFDCIAELAAIVFQEMGGTLIAKDGLTATGKGTLSKMLAKGLGGLHVDSGLFYRIITRELGIKKGFTIETLDEKTLNDFVSSFDFSDVNDADYRTNDVNALVPVWSKVVLIRKYAHYLEMKKVYSQTNPIVIAEGRDMTTRVFTKAKYKFYIDCSLDIRAHWRTNQSNGVYGFVHNEIANRDKLDMERAIDPVRYVPELGVIKIINEKSPEEGLLQILSHIK